MVRKLNGIGLVVIALLLMGMVTTAFAGDAPGWIGAFFVKGKVGLKWTPADGASEYKVYRKSAAGEYEVILTTDKTHHFDVAISPGETYTYKIAAVKADGSEAATPEEKSVTIPGAAGGGEFKAPTWVGLRVDRNKLFLNWDPVPGAIAYNVYRTETPGAGYQLVGSAQAAKYADKDGLVMGNTYYYVLSAMNEMFEETEYSEEMSIKFGMSAEEKKAQEEAENKIDLVEIPLTYQFDIKAAGGNGDMNQPVDVDIDSKGNIYITDALNQRVNVFGPDGSYLFSWGEQTPKGEEDNAPDGTFSYPFSIFIDKTDNIYITDVMNHDIQVFNTEGKFIKRIRLADESGKEAFRPNCLHVLDDGRILVTDAGNHRFLMIDQTGKIIYEKGQRGGGDGEFVFPDGITVTKDGIICVVDVINCRVQQFDLDGNFIRKFGQPGQSAGTFGRPKELTLGEDGQIWVSDAMGHIIQVFSPEGEIKSVVATFGRDDVVLSTPRGMMIKNGKFYVINRLPHQLLVFTIG